MNKKKPVVIIMYLAQFVVVFDAFKWAIAACNVQLLCTHTRAPFRQHFIYFNVEKLHKNGGRCEYVYVFRHINDDIRLAKLYLYNNNNDDRRRCHMAQVHRLFIGGHQTILWLNWWLPAERVWVNVCPSLRSPHRSETTKFAGIFKPG